jgi:isopenicillin N synthase-like dioxygenase
MCSPNLVQQTHQSRSVFIMDETLIQKVDYNDPNAPKLFASSLKNTGFAVITNHQIPESLLNEVYASWAKFFASETKETYKFDPVSQSGFFPFQSENAKDSPVKDLKEFYHIYPSTVLPPLENEESTWKLRLMLVEMASTLLSWLEEETPVEIRSKFSEPLPDMIKNSNNSLFRILHYPPITNVIEEGAVRSAAHEDINLITLLPAATTSGLQVLDINKRWVDVDYDAGNIIVNAGDMLQLCSNHHYKSTTHRVINPSGESAKLPRYSMPLFLHPRSEVMLSSTKSAKMYLEERLREIGLLK